MYSIEYVDFNRLYKIKYFSSLEELLDFIFNNNIFYTLFVYDFSKHCYLFNYLIEE